MLALGEPKTSKNLVEFAILPWDNGGITLVQSKNSNNVEKWWVYLTYIVFDCRGSCVCFYSANGGDSKVPKSSFQGLGEGF